MLRRVLTLPVILAALMLFALILLGTMWLYGYGLFSTSSLRP